eukprot:g4149.t1
MSKFKLDSVLPSTEQKVNRECFSESVPSICRALMPHWSKLSNGDINVSVVEGGLTNFLFKAESQNGGRPVLIRVFGENTELTVDRLNEFRILEFASRNGFGAQLLGFFGNGRLETFIDSRRFGVDDMCHPAAVPKIAKKMSDFHNLRPDITSPRPGILHCINDYFAKAEQIRFDDVAKQKKFEEKFDFQQIKRAIQEAERQCASMTCPIVLCHNDLVPENILLLKQPGRSHTLEGSQITFIDFEYSSYSYRGIDLSGYFIEHQGNEMNPSRYPSETQRRKFLEHYLHYSAGRDNVADNPTVDQLLKEVDFFTPFPHGMYGLWAIIQSRYSPIDFDYLDYALKRLSIFLEHFGN